MVTAVGQRLFQLRRWELFAGKNESNLTVFVPNRHAIRKRSAPRHAPDIDAKFRIAPYAGSVERFVTETVHHSEQLSLGGYSGQLCDETYDSGQGCLL
jgi:hypothetical protein